MKQQKKPDHVALVFLGIFVLWLSAILAYAYEDRKTVFEVMGRFSELLERPLAIRWTPHTLKFMAAGLLAYSFAIVMYTSSRQNRRPGEEHGSAKWGNVYQLDRKYRDKDPKNNVVLTQHFQMSLNGRMHLRNLLQIVVGGSGSGKTRYVVFPKESIVYQTTSQSKGRNGNTSVSTQLMARDLMTPDEVRKLDNRYAIVLLRGEEPFLDAKYDLMHHPNIRYTAHGGAKPYTHIPVCLYDVGDLDFTFTSLDDIEITE